MNVTTKDGDCAGLVHAEQMAGFGNDPLCILRCYISPMPDRASVNRIDVSRGHVGDIVTAWYSQPTAISRVSKETAEPAEPAGPAGRRAWDARRIEFREANQWIEVWLLAHPMKERKKRRKMVRDFLLHAGKDPGEIAGADLDAYAAILATGSYAYFSVAQASIRAFTSFMAQRTTNPPVPIEQAPQEIRR